MDFEKIVKKLLREILGKVGGSKGKRMKGASYFFNGSYPMLYVVDNPPSKEELDRRLNALKYIIDARIGSVAYQGSGVRADFKTFSGDMIGKPNTLVIGFVLTFYGVDPESGRRIIYPDDIVRQLAMNYAQDLEDSLKMAGFKEIIFLPTPPSPQILRELGFNVASFSSMKRIVLFDESYILKRDLGMTPQPQPVQPQRNPFQPQPVQPGAPQGYPQQPVGVPQGTPSPYGNQPQRGGFNAPANNWAPPSGGFSADEDEQSFDVSDNLDIGVVDESDLGDVIPDFSDEEGGVDGKTNQFLNKMQLYKIMEQNGFDRDTAEKYKLLDKMVTPDEMKKILNDLLEDLKKSGKPYALLDIGVTIDNSPVYLPYVFESNNSVAVFGQASFGKSVGSLAIISELIFRGFPVLIIDVTGEWEIFINKLMKSVNPDEIAKKYNNDGFKNITVNTITIKSFENRVENNKTFQFPLKKLTMKELSTLMKVATEGASRSAGFGQHQQAVIIALLKKLEKNQLYDSDGNKVTDMGKLCDFFIYNDTDKIVELLGLPADKEVKKAVSSLKSVFMVIASRDDVVKMFGDETLKVSDIDKPNTVTIVRFPAPAQADKVEKAITVITTIKLLQQIYDNRIRMYRKQGGTYSYPLHFFIEECHNFTKLSSLKDIVAEQFAREVVTMIAKIIKEARKYGVSMHFSSQDPSDVEEAILNQVPTVFFGSIPKKDVQFLQNLFNIDDELIEYTLSMKNTFHEFLMFSNYYAKDRPLLIKFRKLV